MAAAVPFIMLAVAVAGTAYSVSQSQKAGKQRESEFQRQAEQSKLAAAQLAQDTREKHQRIVATQEAIYGKSGVTPEGSPLLVQHESMIQSKEQLRRIYEAGENQSLSLLQSGEDAATVGQSESIKSLMAGAQTTNNIGTSFNWW